MKGSTLLMEESAIDDFMRERMLEGVLEVGEAARFVEKLSRLEVTQPATERLLVLVRDRLEEGKGEVLPDDRGSLEEPFLLGGQTVDARGQNGLHCAGHVDRRQTTRQLVGASWARQCARLDQRANTLLDEKWIALGPLYQEALDQLQASLPPSQDLTH